MLLISFKVIIQTWSQMKVSWRFFSSTDMSKVSYFFFRLISNFQLLKVALCFIDGQLDLKCFPIINHTGVQSFTRIAGKFLFEKFPNFDQPLARTQTRENWNPLGSPLSAIKQFLPSSSYLLSFCQLDLKTDVSRDVEEVEERDSWKLKSNRDLVIILIWMNLINTIFQAEWL